MDSKILEIFYSERETLIPLKTHNVEEITRQVSSYEFFVKIINHDLKEKNCGQADVLDIGFDSGFGYFMLSKMPGIGQITGMDISCVCKSFAHKNYGERKNNYAILDAKEFLEQDHSFEYVVSRGVLEHMPDGLNLVQKAKYTQRLIIDVPYDQKPGGHHRILLALKEDAFNDCQSYELFYEGLDGTIYDSSSKPLNANMILFVASREGAKPINEMFDFPIQPVDINYVNQVSLAKFENDSMELKNNYFFHKEPSDLLLAVEKIICHVDVVLDIGPGIRPMNYFRPKLHFMIEPFDEYSHILNYRFSNDGSVFVLSGLSQELIGNFASNSVDSVFLLDVIEHMPKEDGILVLAHAERIARKQVVIFTPLGFMPQSMHEGEKDGWGLNGASVQEHLSGWKPEDFNEGWDFHICESFHRVDFKGETLAREHGAFFAVKSFSGKPSPEPQSIPELRGLLPSEIELNKANLELAQRSSDLLRTQSQLTEIQSQLNSILSHPAMKAIKKIKDKLNLG